MCALTPARVASGRGAAIRYSLGDASAAVELALDENGHVITIATGHGWRWFTSAIWSEIQQSSTPARGNGSDNAETQRADQRSMTGHGTTGRCGTPRGSVAL